MWNFILPMLGNAVLGAVKNSEAKKQEDADRSVAAATQRYSPWTGMQAGPIRTAGSAVGDVAQGAISGAMFGQGLEAADAANKLQGAQTSYWEEMLKQKKGQPSLYGGGSASGSGLLGVNTNLGY